MSMADEVLFSSLNIRAVAANKFSSLTEGKTKCVDVYILPED